MRSRNESADQLSEGFYYIAPHQWDVWWHMMSFYLRIEAEQGINFEIRGFGIPICC